MSTEIVPLSNAPPKKSMWEMTVPEILRSVSERLTASPPSASSPLASQVSLTDTLRYWLIDRLKPATGVTEKQTIGGETSEVRLPMKNEIFFKKNISTGGVNALNARIAEIIHANAAAEASENQVFFHKSINPNQPYISQIIYKHTI